MGLRGVVYRAGLIVLEKEEQVLPLHLIPALGEGGKIRVPQQLQAPIDAGMDGFILL